MHLPPPGGEPRSINKSIRRGEETLTGAERGAPAVRGGTAAGSAAQRAKYNRGDNRREPSYLSRKHTPLHCHLPLGIVLPGTRGRSDCYVTEKLPEEGGTREKRFASESP
ncbi:unnamed protein product [Rangifer tarandus platyrhynchus]|uniref:Uncharacterized protein n=2 Tax=Rangifer tarandus platyrhynchus TaxID=3082113 RepID=A0ACB0F6Y4_RANTA|nr:unnamed protein product [Rangifer tarandus platyrhynchus]CAI9707841.1 unnamed protein product [Rangifer tarandus platyrhynchus]